MAEEREEMPTAVRLAEGMRGVVAVIGGWGASLSLAGVIVT